MSRLSDLLAQVSRLDPQLGQDLGHEVKALAQRRQFGLNFERHTPESVDLYGRPVRRGDKVRILPPRGEADPPGRRRLWEVRTVRVDVAELTDGDERTRVAIEDLVVVAEHRDRIFLGLVSTGRVERGGDKPFHTVINAENFHALEALAYTHEGKVDAIYIDPPYNTGAKDWKYNNDYVDADDIYRHSKWLAFMERRLKLAKRLLNPENSVLIVTIDEKEYLRLGLLLQQAFPESPLTMVSSVINPAGAGRTADFSRTDEYIYFVRVGAARVLPERREVGETPVVWDTLRRSSLAGRRGNRGPGACGPNQFFPIYVDPNSGRIVEIGSPLPESVAASSAPERPGLVTVLPIRPNGIEMNWGVTDVAASRLLEHGYLRAGQARPREPQKYVISYLTGGIVRDIRSGVALVRGKHPNGAVDAYYPTGRDKMPMSNWNRPAHDAQQYGTKVLRSLIPERRFPYPKSLYAVEDALRFFVADKPDAVVLDFFAGSGTTAHAVMRLNKQDGGRRQCISVTNNEVSAEEQGTLRKERLRPGDPEWEERGICDYITKPRIEAAITGKTPEGQPIKGDYKFSDEFPMSDGFEENAEFFTLTYEDPLRVEHHRSFDRIAPLLWLKAGAQGSRIEKQPDRRYAVADTYAILFDLDAAHDFLEEVAKTDGLRMAFVLTADERAYQAICAELPAHVRAERLYGTYLTQMSHGPGVD